MHKPAVTKTPPIMFLDETCCEMLLFTRCACPAYSARPSVQAWESKIPAPEEEAYMLWGKKGYGMQKKSVSLQSIH